MTKACELCMILKQMNRGDNSEMHPFSRPHLPLSTSELVFGGYNISLCCVKNKQFQKSTHTLSLPLSPPPPTSQSSPEHAPELSYGDSLAVCDSVQEIEEMQKGIYFCRRIGNVEITACIIFTTRFSEWTQKAVYRSSERLSGTTETILMKSGNTIRN